MVRVIESGSWTWMVGSWWCGMRAREALSATGCTPGWIAGLNADDAEVVPPARYARRLALCQDGSRGCNADDAEVVPPALCG